MRVCQFRHFGPMSGVHNTFRTCPVKQSGTNVTARLRPIGARGTNTKSSRPLRPAWSCAEPRSSHCATVRNGEAWLLGCHISPYSHGTDANHDPERDRKLLLHARELARLSGKIAERGLTLVPLRLYFKSGRAKLEVGLGRGKKLHDKRSTLREREVKREMDRAARAGSRERGWR